MELTEFNPAGFGDQYVSLRARKAPSSEFKESAAHFDWSSNPDEDEDEDEDSPKTKNLKELPLPMGLKRAIWQVQQMRVPVVSRWGSSHLRCSRFFLHFRAEAADLFSKVELWRKTMHKIGGQFGGGVQSYFLFLRFLVVLNFLSFLLIAGFVIIPSAVFLSNNSSGESLSPSLNLSLNLSEVNECLTYTPQLEPLTVFYTYFLDLLSGTGFMEYSFLFYGFYNNTEVVSSGFSYNIPLAYLLSAAFYFLFCLLCIIIRMGGLVQVVTSIDGGRLGGYSALVFTGWDHGLEGERAAKMKQNNLRYRLQVDLEEDRIKQEASSLTLGQAVALWSLRLFLNLVVLAMIVGALFAIAYATQFSQSAQQGGLVGLLLEYLPSMVITLSNFVVPFLCDQIATLEKYSPSTTVILALLRAVFLRLVSLAALLYSLWKQITCDGNTETLDCSPCRYNHKQYQCWETRVGQEMYKLTLFDFLITIAVMILVEFPRRLVVDHCSCKLAQLMGRQEFVVASNVLALVYSQTVVWSGALFCPILPLINTIKFIIIFYCKKATLFQNCRPALRTFRSTTSNVFFFLVLLFGWILSCVVLIYSVASIHPSYGCGPFRFSSSMWRVVPDSIDPLTETTREFLFFIGSQSFSIPLFVCSCVLLCYVAALTVVHGKTVDQLKTQQQMEGRDKQFLVKQIKDLSAEVQKVEEGSQRPARESRIMRDSESNWRGNDNPAFAHDDQTFYSPATQTPRAF